MDELPCICIAVRKASRRLTTRYDAALAPIGVSLAQFSLLRNIDRHGPISLTALADIVELDRSTLGRNLRVLEKQDLVVLGEGQDQREAVTRLSGQGKNTLDHATPLWHGVQDQLASQLGAAGAAQLETLLGAL